MRRTSSGPSGSSPLDRHAFDVDPSTYDAMVDWQRRLAREEPLYRQIFRGKPAARVLDAACGTGHHADLFHEWGHDVVGADLDEAMVDFCRQKYGEDDRLSWRRQSIFDPPDREAAFDFVICVGNSLALAGDREQFQRGLNNLLRHLRPGGVAVFHLLNIWRLPEGPLQWQKSFALPPNDDAATRVIMKGVHRCADRAFITFVDLRVEPTSVAATPHTTELLGIRAHWLRDMLHKHGGRGIQLYGDYDRSPYAPRTSPDLIAVCTRA